MNRSGASAPGLVGWLARFERRSPQSGHGYARVGSNDVYILPTASGLGLTLALLVLLLGALNYQNNLGLLFVFLTIAVAIVSMHQCWSNLSGLRAAILSGPPVFAGEHAEFRVVLSETAGRARYALKMADAFEGAAGVNLAPQGEVSCSGTRPTIRRGLQPLHSVMLETRFPFGLFRSWCWIATDARILVYPRPAKQAPQPHSATQGERHPGGDRGIGAEDFIGSRAYLPGDSTRFVDWKAYARSRGLVVKQFGGEGTARVLIDWNEVQGTTEERLSLLARQVVDIAELGWAFGLRLPAKELQLDRGEVHKHRCLEALALFEPGQKLV